MRYFSKEYYSEKFFIALIQTAGDKSKVKNGSKPFCIRE